MPRACALGCAPSNVSKHTFPDPIKYPERFRLWVRIAGGNLTTHSDYDAYRKKKVCDKHFTQKDRNRNKRLNALAVPSQYLPSGVLHIFPNPKKFPELFKAWIKIVNAHIGFHKSNINYKNVKVCDHHFTDKDRNRNNRLNALAVPSLYLPVLPNPIELPIHLSDHTYCRQEKPGHSYTSDKLTEEYATPVNTESSSNAVLEDNVDDDSIADNYIETEIVEPPQMFSWEQEEVEEICLDGDDGELYTDKETAVYKSHSGKNDQEVPSIKGFVCNNCNTVIERFVYKCVQCFDFDLCGDCERAGEHCTHFLLRVPEDKHRDEVQAVLSRIRQELFVDAHSEIKNEIKAEPTDPGDPIGSPLKTTNADDLHSHTKTLLFLDRDKENRLIEDADGNFVNEDTCIVQDIDMLSFSPVHLEEDSETEDQRTEAQSLTTSRISKRLHKDSDDFEPNSSESESEACSGDPLEIRRPPAKRPRMLLKGPRRKTVETTAMAPPQDTRIVNKTLYVALKPMSIEELAKYKIS